MGPINFEKAKKEREQAVIARLIDIRKAQQEYRSLHHGMYTEHFDTLIDFVKNQKLPFVMKVGQLTDKQLEDGLTEKKAMAIINKAQKTGRYDEVKKWGLENFKRDTMWVAVMDTVYPKGFNPDSMKYIPHGNGAIFEMNVKNDTAKSGAPVFLFEVKAPYETYLGGLDKQEIILSLIHILHSLCHALQQMPPILRSYPERLVYGRIQLHPDELKPRKPH